MSTTGRTTPAALPALVAGQHLDRRTFHERYEAMPTGTRAELIGGVVVMPSLLGRDHARASVPVIIWLSHYKEATPGVEVLDNATVLLDDRGEPQPDALLRILPEHGGQTRDVHGYVAGAPELVVEISHATRDKDLGAKLLEYERAGVMEYIVVLTEGEVRWHARREGRLVPQEPGPDMAFRSEVFPGLWLDSHALQARDHERLREVLDRGIATPQHKAFVDRLRTAFNDNRTSGRAVGWCECGHAEPDHGPVTEADLPPRPPANSLDLDRAAGEVEAQGGACSLCACPRFTWKGWGLAESREA